MTILPVTIRGVYSKAQGSIQALYVFADTAKLKNGSIIFDDFSFEEGHGEVSYAWYKHYTYRLTPMKTSMLLHKLQEYYNSIPDDTPVKLKVVNRLDLKCQ
jgi:hypothetical protein